MFQPAVSIPPQSTPYAPYTDDRLAPLRDTFPDAAIEVETGALDFLGRRWRRERRRRKVGRAYDMALEIARVVPRDSRVLDVGCGNGFIAHHLSAMLGTRVMGIDLNETTEAPIEYLRFDGLNFPVRDESLDVVLLCYVLHHARNLQVVMSELRRVLSNGGWVVVYEDIPESWWDRFVCSIHDRKWRNRTGACTFRLEDQWRTFFRSAGFEIIKERSLSRWRNLAHPVSRRFYVLKLQCWLAVR